MGTMSRADRSNDPPQTSAATTRQRGEWLRVTQVNLNRSHEAWDDILADESLKSHVILAQEPPLTGRATRVKASGGYTAIFDKRADKPRASIMVSKSMGRNIFLLDKLTDRDTVTILLKVGTNAVILSSMYMDRNMECPPKLLGEIQAHARKNNNKLVIATDTNAHSSAWGATVNDAVGRKRGDDLLDTLVGLDLHFVNRNCPYTFNNGRWKNVIDLTITNNDTIDTIENWKTVEGTCRSDHLPITFGIRDLDSSKTRTFQSIKMTNWPLYKAQEERGLEILGTPAINSIEELDTATENLTKTLIEAFQDNTPTTYISAQTKDPPWLTAEVKQSRAEMLSKLRHAQHTKVEEDWKLARSARKEYTKIRNQSKNKSWKEWAEELDAYSDAQKVSQVLKSSQFSKLGCVFDKHGNLTQSPGETLKVMEEVHHGDTHTTRPTLDGQIPAPKGEWSDDTTFSQQRIKRALKEFAPLTGAGPDGIRPIMIQKAADAIVGPFANIAKASYRLGVTPKLWQEAEAIYIPKPGKDDYRQPKSFRTITKSSNLQKLMERVVLWHIETDQKVHKKLNKNQYGFRRGVSTETALHKVVRKIESTLMHKGIAIGTFLDIEGAFDNVAFEAIERALHKKLKDKRTAVWITYLITNRKVTTTLMGETITTLITKGCPQGGILSPFLWNLVMDDLLNHSKNKIPGDLQGFADDLCLLVSTNLPSTGRPSADVYPLREATQRGLRAINAWCKSVGLKLSALKSQLVIFTHRKNITITDAIQVDGNPIPVCESTKFLGITLDSKLNWNEHVRKQTKKAKMILMQCRRVIGPTWGLNPRTARWIYTSIVRPTLSYGAMVWANAMLTKSNKDEMMKVQRLALKMVTGALPSTPSTALDTITDTTPIVDHLRYCAARTAYTLMATGEWDGPIKSELKNPKVFTSHANTVSKDLEALQKGHQEHDLSKPELTLDRDFNLEIPDREKFEVNESNFDCVAYTDGSRIDNNTGAGFVIRQHGVDQTQQAFNLGPEGTVPAAEMFAIQQTTKTMLDMGTANKRILINCDSQGTIKGLDTTITRSKTTLKTLRNLNTLSIFNEVTVRWIPAHRGYDGNELADALAKKGAQETENVTPLPLPKAAAYAALRNKVRSNSIELTKHMDLLWNNDHGKTLCKLNKKNLRAATHLLTGHSHLNYHMHKLKKVDSPLCNACGLEDETVKHVLTSCPALWKLRQECFHTLSPTIDDIKYHHPLNRTIRFFRRAMEKLHPSAGSGATV